jgi:hypothetical protein
VVVTTKSNDTISVFPVYSNWGWAASRSEAPPRRPSYRRPRGR